MWVAAGPPSVEIPPAVEILPEPQTSPEKLHPEPVLLPPVAVAVFRDIRTTTESTSNPDAQVKELWGSKRPLLIAAAAVLVLAVLGAIVWRPHKNPAGNNPVKAAESKVPDVTQSPAENKEHVQPVTAADSETHVPTPTQPNEKQAKPQEQSATSTPPPTVQPAKQASKLDDKQLLTPAPMPKTAAKANIEEAALPSGTTGVPGSVPGGVTSAVPNSVVGAGIPAAKPTLSAQSAQKVRVSSGVAEGLLVSQVTPLYPLQARQAHIRGTVVLQAVIGKDGSVQSVRALRGDPMLIQSAVDAVKKWRYKPYYLNGEPVEAETQISVNFNP